MSGAILTLPNTPSWRGAQLKPKDNFTFTFTTIDHQPWYVSPFYFFLFSLLLLVAEKCTSDVNKILIIHSAPFAPVNRELGLK
jgi:hypothetical protein